MKTNKIVPLFLKCIFKYFYKLYLSGWEINEKNILIISNHTSYLDAFIIWYLYPYPVTFLYKTKPLKIKLVLIIKIIAFIFNIDILPVHKLRTAIKKLNEGKTVVIFPEGQINRTKKVFLPFQPGWKFLAKHSVVPIYRFDIRKYKREFHIYIERIFDGYRKEYE